MKVRWLHVGRIKQLDNRSIITFMVFSVSKLTEVGTMTSVVSWLFSLQLLILLLLLQLLLLLLNNIFVVKVHNDDYDSHNFNYRHILDPSTGKPFISLMSYGSKNRRVSSPTVTWHDVIDDLFREPAKVSEDTSMTHWDCPEMAKE